MKLATLRVKAPRTESERRDGRLCVVDDRAGRVAGKGLAAPRDDGSRARGLHWPPDAIPPVNEQRPR